MDKKTLLYIILAIIIGLLLISSYSSNYNLEGFKGFKKSKKWKNQFEFIESAPNIKPSWFGLPILVSKKYVGIKNIFLMVCSKSYLFKKHSLRHKSTSADPGKSKLKILQKRLY